MKFTELAKLQRKQKDAWFTLMKPECKYLLYGGAMGGGKSYLLRWAALGLGIYYRKKYHIQNPPIGLFSQDYPTLRDRQIARIAQEFPDYLGTIKESKEFGLAFHVADEYGGARIMLRNLDDPSKYKSTEFVSILVEELTENTEDKFRMLRNRLRYPGIEDVKFLAATNPGDIGHGWCKKFFIDRISDDIEQDKFFYVPSTVYDNKYQTDSYRMQLQSLPENERKAYLEGSWDVFEGQYFTEFNRNLHVMPVFVPKPEVAKYGGMDWGRTAPFAFLATAIVKESHEGINFNRAITFAEVYGTNKTPSEWAEIIKLRVNIDEFEWLRGDPAMFSKGQDGSTSIADQFNMSGVYIQPANNDRIAGWELMHKWLSIAPDGLPYWLITENCRNLIRTLPELIHDENKVEDVDCFVKGTKVSTPNGNRNIEELKVGELVNTPLGSKRIIKAGISGRSERVITVYFSNGKKLTGTANHKVFVHNKGMVELQKLCRHDILEVENITWTAKQKQSFIREWSTTREKVGLITSPMEHISKKDTHPFIDKFILTILEKFQKAMTFIIRIITTTIMTQIIWWLLLATNTLSTTIKSIIKQKKTKYINGIILRKANWFSEIMLKKCVRILQRENFRAKIVEELLKQDNQNRLGVKNVRNTKEQTKNNVLSVVQSLDIKTKKMAKPVHIVAVGHYEEKIVYKLTVEQAHLYYANGILVTNTDGEDHAPDAQRYIFKHLHWIDAKVGGTHQAQISRPKIRNKRPIMRVDLDAFATGKRKSKRDYGV